ncbi:hypothetical protein BKA63DRAFT_587462 [Paraphoma chrysanthemicola]|nr:hypothetical protein BKA63DRAFT_587462 [Paraphoma chrysanthemicola]
MQIGRMRLVYVARPTLRTQLNLCTSRLAAAPQPITNINMTQPGAKLNPYEGQLEDILKFYGLPHFPDLPTLAEVTARLQQRASTDQNHAKPAHEQLDYWQKYARNAHTLAIQYAKEAEDLRGQVDKLECEARENESVRNMSNLVQSLSLRQEVVDAEFVKLRDAIEDDDVTADDSDSLVTNDTERTFRALVQQLQQRTTNATEDKKAALEGEKAYKAQCEGLDEECDRLREELSTVKSAARVASVNSRIEIGSFFPRRKKNLC